MLSLSLSLRYFLAKYGLFVMQVDVIRIPLPGDWADHYRLRPSRPNATARISFLLQTLIPQRGQSKTT